MSFSEDKPYFHNIDFSTEPLPSDDFEQANFVNCSFAELMGITLTDCIFTDCNLSNVSFRNSKLDNVTFLDCKLTGIDISVAKDFALQVKFENCILDYAIFEQKKLNKSIFSNCRIQGADFTQADLSKSKFHNCDFSEAVFSNTNVSGVDFTTSKYFTIDPTINNVKKAKFLSSDLAGLLTRFDIIIK
ncbi:pentapeptide repeat-containing protein [Dyadobacter luteus]|uniref:Pentapeptide repeat-containing protein n=1 Tax=Dyadobacter luteus TaxID=2259619 RepID=A0A3D8Y437_9BACT|nr:pentapeptide repeat-containing protein [Dyadobacter luteus]REA56974.1 pentapeptide repeat-containing protein [Dyadobacter luteus]